MTYRMIEALREVLSEMGPEDAARYNAAMMAAIDLFDYGYKAEDLDRYMAPENLRLMIDLEVRSRAKLAAHKIILMRRKDAA